MLNIQLWIITYNFVILYKCGLKKEKKIPSNFNKNLNPVLAYLFYILSDVACTGQPRSIKIKKPLVFSQWRAGRVWGTENKNWGEEREVNMKFILIYNKMKHVDFYHDVNRKVLKNTEHSLIKPKAWSTALLKKILPNFIHEIYLNCMRWWWNFSVILILFFSLLNLLS